MKALTIGIDMGGTNIKIGTVQDDKIVETIVIPAYSNNLISEKLKDIESIVNHLLSKSQIKPIGIGVSFPDIVDNIQMRIHSRFVKHPGASYIDLSEWANEKWQIPLVLENDARAALFGEWQYGAGKTCNDIVLVTLGTGIGSSAMINGNVLVGKNFKAGILGGHFTINFDGDICSCGNMGCLETEASTWNLPNKVKLYPEYNQSMLKNEKHIDFNVLFRLASKGDRLSIKVRDKCIQAWGLGIVNLIHAYDPTRVIIGGGIMRSKEQILPKVITTVFQNSWIAKDSINIVAAEHIDTAGILGVNYLVKQRLLKKI